MVKRNILFMGWPMLMKVKHDGEMLMYWVIDMCIIEYTEYKRIQYINTWVQHWKRGQYRHFRCLQKQGNHSLQTICPRLKKNQIQVAFCPKPNFFRVINFIPRCCRYRKTMVYLMSYAKEVLLISTNFKLINQ